MVNIFHREIELGQDHPFLRDLGFQCLESFLHRLKIMALLDTAHAGR